MRPLSTLPQDDFRSLALAATSEDESSQQLGNYYWSTPVEGAGSGGSPKSVAASVNYRPAIFISDEMQEMIWNWEHSYPSQQEMTCNAESMDSEPITTSIESVFEPVRPMLGSSLPPPPKRFYRTFWRSLTLRIVRREKERALDGQPSCALVSPTTV